MAVKALVGCSCLIWGRTRSHEHEGLNAGQQMVSSGCYVIYFSCCRLPRYYSICYSNLLLSRF